MICTDSTSKFLLLCVRIDQSIFKIWILRHVLFQITSTRSLPNNIQEVAAAAAAAAIPNSISGEIRELDENESDREKDDAATESGIVELTQTQQSQFSQQLSFSQSQSKQ